MARNGVGDEVKHELGFKRGVRFRYMDQSGVLVVKSLRKDRREAGINLFRTVDWPSMETTWAWHMMFSLTLILVKKKRYLQYLLSSITLYFCFRKTMNR